jgi:hypothetical protein
MHTSDTVLPWLPYWWSILGLSALRMPWLHSVMLSFSRAKALVHSWLQKLEGRVNEAVGFSRLPAAGPDSLQLFIAKQVRGKQSSNVICLMCPAGNCPSLARDGLGLDPCLPPQQPSSLSLSRRPPPYNSPPPTPAYVFPGLPLVPCSSSTHCPCNPTDPRFPPPPARPLRSLFLPVPVSCTCWRASPNFSHHTPSTCPSPCH